MVVILCFLYIFLKAKIDIHSIRRYICFGVSNFFGKF